MRFPYQATVGSNLRAVFGWQDRQAQARNLGHSSITKGDGSLDLYDTEDGPVVASYGDLPDGTFGVGVLQGGQIVNVAGVFSDHAGRLDGHATRLGNAEGRLDSHAQRIGAVEGDASGLASRIGNAEGRLDSHAQRIGATESKNTSQDTRLGNLEEGRQSHASRIGALENRMDVVEDAYSDLKQTVQQIWNYLKAKDPLFPSY